MNKNFRRPYLVSATTALALMSFNAALAEAENSIVSTGQKHMKAAVNRPLLDLNVTQTDIPAALRSAARAPYAPAEKHCDAIKSELVQLDAALGPDFDAKISGAASKNKAIPKPSELGGEAVASVIPYEGALRFVTGADNRDRKVAEMYLAGAVRRAYLKGIGEARGCSTAAPLRIQSTAK